MFPTHEERSPGGGASKCRLIGAAFKQGFNILTAHFSRFVQRFLPKGLTTQVCKLPLLSRNQICLDMTSSFAHPRLKSLLKEISEENSTLQLMTIRWRKYISKGSMLLLIKTKWFLSDTSLRLRVRRFSTIVAKTTHINSA